MFLYSIPAPGVFRDVNGQYTRGRPIYPSQALQQPLLNSQMPYMSNPFQGAQGMMMQQQPLTGMMLQQQASTGARITPIDGVSTPQFLGATANPQSQAQGMMMMQQQPQQQPY